MSTGVKAINTQGPPAGALKVDQTSRGLDSRFQGLGLSLELREDARRVVTGGAGAASEDLEELVASMLDEVRGLGEEHGLLE